MEELLQNPAIQTLRKLVGDSDWAGKVWLVGGCVRDTLLKRKVSADFDLVLEGDAVALAAWLGENGAKHLATYPRFGTAAVLLNEAQFEFVSARRESYLPSSRKPNVGPGSLLDDAKRRDFTCNALMVNLQDGRLIDLLGVGMADLRDGILRTPLEPQQTFFDDPLRMLRAVRFRWQLGFLFSPGLAEAIQMEAPRLQAISAERIRDEFSKMIRSPEALQELMDLGLMINIMPELLTMPGVEQGKWHHLDVWKHTLLVIANAASDDLILNLACLLHDVAKPATRSIDDKSQTRFFGHEVVGAEMAAAILHRLRFDKDTIEAVVLLVKNHMRLMVASEITAPACRRLIRDLGSELDRLMQLVAADMSALKPGTVTMDIDEIRKRILSIAESTPAATIRSPLSGREVMDLLKLSEGPEVGKVMIYLTEEVIEGRLAPNDSAAAERMALARFSQ